MKTNKLFRIMAMFAIIFLLAFTACDDGNGGGGDDNGGNNNPNNGGGNNPNSGSYTVKFDANGGNGTAPSSETVNAGFSIVLPSAENLEMYNATFIGWNTSADSTGTNYSAGSSYTPSSSITLYANWNVSIYTIEFDANGGNGYTNSRQVPKGYSTTLPSNEIFSAPYATFDGWNSNADGSGTNYTANSSYTPTGNASYITLYARWTVTVPLSSVDGLVDKLVWLQVHAKSNNNYTVEVDTDETLEPYTLSFPGRSNITITLIGIGTIRNIILSYEGSLFTVDSGITLILDNNITLQGHNYNTSSLVLINSGGKLIMNNGASISGNTSDYGGGVRVSGTNANFTMNGGEISDNYVSHRRNFTSSGGGGVYVCDSASFTMSGGKISGNTAFESYSSTNYWSHAAGGGVYVESGTFTMSGGEISGNTVTGELNSEAHGGGVYVEDTGTFTMTGGVISDNTASSNRYSYFGFGAGGGGVYLRYTSTFNKTGGTIYGYNVNDEINSNVVKNSSEIINNEGNAVYGGTVNSVRLCRETTAGPDVNLFRRETSFSGGWEF